MCGRAYIKLTPAVLKYCRENNINIMEWDHDLYLPNMPPTSQMPIIIRSEIGLKGIMARWLLHPHWSKEPPKSHGYTFNARIETVLTLRSFKDPVRMRRAIVPMQGFIEWQRAGNEKQPYYVDADPKPLLMAGIWDSWRDQGASFAIITQPASADFGWLHDRMPLSLTEGQANLWMDHATPAEVLINDLSGCSLELQPKKVSQKINNARNKEPLEFID